MLNEELTIKQLCKKAKIPHGKAYSILHSLEAKDLIKISETRPAKAHVPNASETIGKLIKQKQQEHEILLTNLRALATQTDAIKTQTTQFFQTGTTLEDNKNIQMRTFTEAKKEICQILNIHHKPQSNRTSKTVWEKEIEKAIKRGITFRCIYPTNCELPPILSELNKKQPEKFQVKRLNTDFVRCDIIDKNKTLIKLIHQDATQYGGIIFIENEKFANNLQEVFEQFWENAEE